MILRSYPLAAMMLIAVLVSVGAGPALKTKTENFDKEPGWEAICNKVNYHPPQQIHQNYGYDARTGEIGGEVCRSVSRPSWYAKALPKITLKDSIKVQGRFRIPQMDEPGDEPGIRNLSSFHNAGDYFIGFFNSDRQGWRPQNWLGIRFRALKGEALVECTYTTKSWTTGPLLPRDPQHVKPDNQWHTFVIDYDPNASQGDGMLTLTVDDVVRPSKLFPFHKIEDAIFNRFGIRSNEVPGRKFTAYFDDLALTINNQTTTYKFDTDPKWEGNNNHAQYLEDVQYGENDFCYSKTDFAGGKNGEAGGRFWNVNPSPPELLGQYGDAAIGTLNMDMPLHVSGKIALQKFDTDGSMLIGYYNSKQVGFPPRNFIGIHIDGPAKVGRYFQPTYGNFQGKGDAGRLDDPVAIPIEPYSKHEWSMDYNPAANKGAGALTVTLDTKKWTLNLKPVDRAAGATFDRFGMLDEQRANGNSAEVYIDDLSYTVAEKP